MGQFWANFRANFEFSTKKRNGHFFTFINEKNQKNLMRHFENMSKNTDFGLFLPKMANFGQKRANFEFPAKKRNCHFFKVIKPGLYEKNQKYLMRGFLGKCRTDVRESVGLQESRFLETKKVRHCLRSWGHFAAVFRLNNPYDTDLVKTVPFLAYWMCLSL